MQPNLNINDLVIVKKCKINEINENDIITYKKNNKIISHRIIKKEYYKGKIIFTTKGDNNEIEDMEKVTMENIYGKVVANIPKVGKIIRFIQKGNGIVIVISILIIIFIIINMEEKKKNNRKFKRKKYELKKKREEYKL